MVPSLIPGTETYVWVLDFTGIVSRIAFLLNWNFIFSFFTDSLFIIPHYKHSPVPHHNPSLHRHPLLITTCAFWGFVRMYVHFYFWSTGPPAALGRANRNRADDGVVQPAPGGSHQPHHVAPLPRAAGLCPHDQRPLDLQCHVRLRVMRRDNINTYLNIFIYIRHA